MVSVSNERLAQLKAFDETKIGVKGIVDGGISSIPSIFLHPNTDLPPSKASTTNVTIPTIDLSGIAKGPEQRKAIAEKIQNASENWGFFQVVNHGIPNSMFDEVLKGSRRFFEQEDELKKDFYGRDYNKGKFLFNSNFDLYSGAATCWRDSYSCFFEPNPPKPEEIPSICRDILLEYKDKMMKLGKMLFELLSEALGLPPNYLSEIGCTDGIQVIGHYYPPCPQPELTMGTARHADNDFLTVLLQDQIGGLQVLHDDQWIDVPPTTGALVVNIGDLLQLITNDKFQSVEHRVKSNKKGPRLSVSYFFSTGPQPSSRVFGPIKELTSDENPPKYRETTVEEFFFHSRTKGHHGIKALEDYRL